MPESPASQEPAPARGADRPLRAVLEPAFHVGAHVAVLASLILAARNGLLPEQRPLTLPLALWPWFAALYTVPLALATAAAWVVGRWLTPLRRLAAWLPRLAALMSLAVILNENAPWLRSTWDAGAGSARFRTLLALALASSLAGLALAVLWPARRALLPRLAALVALTAFAGAWWPPAAASPAPVARRPARADASAAARPHFLLFGIDGADWRYIDELTARGQLPNLAALRRRGAWGHLQTLPHVGSPVIWTTVATGTLPETHGIQEFTSRYIRGVESPIPSQIRRPKGLGFRWLEAQLERFGWIYQSPVGSFARRVPSYWEVASRYGAPVSVSDWWATWPAEEVLGSIISDRMFFWRFAARGYWTPYERLAYPEALGRDVSSLVMRPEDVTYEQARQFLDVTPREYAAMTAQPFRGKTAEGEFRYLYAMLETDRRLGLASVDWGRKSFATAPDLLVLLRAVDIACHAALRESELVSDHLDASPEDLRRFSCVVTEAYRGVDRVLGELLAELGDDDLNVIVVSDHGFVVEHGSDSSLYHHMSGPPGIFLAAGPAIRPGEVEGLSVVDVMPLLLYLKGLPVAEDLAGRVPMEVFTDGFRDRHEPVTIASFGTRSGLAARGARAIDAEAVERLRALGYVQ